MVQRLSKEVNIAAAGEGVPEVQVVVDRVWRISFYVGLPAEKAPACWRCRLVGELHFMAPWRTYV